MPDMNNLGEEAFMQAHGFRGLFKLPGTSLVSMVTGACGRDFRPFSEQEVEKGEEIWTEDQG